MGKQTSRTGDSGESPPSSPRQGPFGDIIPKDEDSAAAPGGKPQEDVEDRPVVGKIKPSDYPEKDRARSSRF